MPLPQTVGTLREAGYHPVSVKDEMRRNLCGKLRRGEPILPGLIGYDDTVLPQVVHAVLARHDLLLLGTRGQGKTRLLRQLVELLDEAIPALVGCDLRDDPLSPVSAAGRRLIADRGNNAPVEWIGRDCRYGEKLATPDVSMADLFGDIDLMKHVQGQSLSAEGALSFGLIPRANRGLFCINELPDLSPKIQVGLFNLLQERDVQIRGHAVRFALDVCLVFSANPEDYTSRGRIVTPLKDRIGSVIRTHDPRTREHGMAINLAAARIDREGARVVVPAFMQAIVEEVARRARTSPQVNQASGVSARLGIAALELLAAAAERRAMRHDEPAIVPRMTDLSAIVAGARGKLEVLSLEEEGAEDRLLADLLREATRAVHAEHADAETTRAVREWFAAGGMVQVGDGVSGEAIAHQVAACGPLARSARELAGQDAALVGSAAEFLLEGMHLAGQIGKRVEGAGEVFTCQN
jgi:magnesium chelatase subunit I